MLSRFSRRLFLAGGAALGAAGAAMASPPASSLRPVLRAPDFHKRGVPAAADIVDGAGISGQVSYSVADVQTGLRLEDANETLATLPASVTKAITALYALEALGPEHKFVTRLRATGPVVEGIVQGDVILVGGADPTLDTDGLVSMAQELKAAGISGMTGRFLVYEGALPFLARIDTAQPDHVGYNPAVSGIALNFNRVHFEWRRNSGQYAVSMDARSDRYRPAVKMAIMRVQDRQLPVYTYASGQTRDEWTVARSALGNGGSRWLPVRKPGLYAGEVFATVAAAEGLKLGQVQSVDELPDGFDIVRRTSPELRNVLRDMLRFSTNLTAEMVGLAASQARGVKVVSLVQSAAEMNGWAQQTLGMKAPALVDHSGLGSDSRVTADDLVTALIRVRDAGFRDILKPIAMRDEKRRVIKNHPVKVHAKTGTLNFVSSLAGYMTAPDGTEMAFAIVAADEPRRDRIGKANREAPEGGRLWNRRAKAMQQKLIERWGVIYGS